MGHAQFEPDDAEFPGERRRPSRKVQARSALGRAAHFDVMPLHRPDAHAQRFERGLLRREPHREPLGRVVALQAVRTLGGREESFDQPRTPGQRATESIDINEIDADAADHDRQRSARSFTGSVMRSMMGTSTSRSSRNTGSVSVTACLIAP